MFGVPQMGGESQESWWVTLKNSMNQRMLICVFTGFSSGLPFYFIIQLIPAWLRSENVGLKEIGFFSLIQLPYLLKFVWSPLLDRYSLPVLGRRRSWVLVSQIGLLVSLGILGFFQPETELRSILWLSAIVAFFSASQDIVLDAYRRELLPDHELGLGNQIHVQAYRVAGLIPGSLGLILADHFAWDLVFQIVAAFMLVGIGMTIVISEAISSPDIPPSFARAVIDPFKEFIQRRGIRRAILVLAFLFCYKLGDSMATALSTPFYIDLGFSLSEIGYIAKNAALWPAIFGGLAGGVLMLKIGINRALWLFGLVQMLTILGFAVLAEAGADPVVLALVIGMEYLGVGLGAAAFIAFIARESTPALAATQIALFTSVTALPRTFANAITGILVEGGQAEELGGIWASVLEALLWAGLPPEGLGWTDFFVLCTFLAIPGLVLLYWVAPINGDGDSGGNSC